MKPYEKIQAEMAAMRAEIDGLKTAKRLGESWLLQGLNTLRARGDTNSNVGRPLPPLGAVEIVTRAEYPSYADACRHDKAGGLWLIGCSTALHLGGMVSVNRLLKFSVGDRLGCLRPVACLHYQGDPLTVGDSGLYAMDTYAALDADWAPCPWPSARGGKR